jgi:hypothetical protein
MSEPDEAAALEAQLFAQALAVLQRERPNRSATFFFELLSWVVVVAIATTVLYVVQVAAFDVTLERAQPIAIAAAIMYMAIIPLAALNLPFYIQLRRTDGLHRRLAPSWRTRLQGRYRARQERYPVAAPIVRGLLMGLGIVTLLFGSAGLGVELRRGLMYPELFLVALVMTAFGVTALLLPLMARARLRLEVIDDLRTSLLRGDASAYDEVVKFTRGQVSVNRERSIKEAAPASSPRLTYQESRAVRDAKDSLEASELVGVLAHINGLISNPPESRADAARPDKICYEPIEATDLEIGYTIDPAGGKITLLSLDRIGNRPAADVTAQMENTEYTVNVPDSVRVLDERLSPEQRKVVHRIIAAVAEDPARFEPRASHEEGGQRVRWYPSPPVAVAYNVDEETKTVNVVHVSPALRARTSMFISYAREDRDDLTRLMKYLRPLERDGLVNFWFDELIEASDRWRDKIINALEKSNAALLLITQDFIDSEFIRNVELPELLKREAGGGLKIFWIPMRHSSVLDDYQAFREIQALLTPPDVPLSALELQGPAKAEEALLGISQTLRKVLVKERDVGG